MVKLSGKDVVAFLGGIIVPLFLVTAVLWFSPKRCIRLLDTNRLVFQGHGSVKSFRFFFHYPHYTGVPAFLLVILVPVHTAGTQKYHNNCHHIPLLRIHVLDHFIYGFGDGNVSGLCKRNGFCCHGPGFVADYIVVFGKASICIPDMDCLYFCWPDWPTISLCFSPLTLSNGTPLNFPVSVLRKDTIAWTCLVGKFYPLIISILKLHLPMFWLKHHENTDM